ncbi:MAG: hypothetical protein K2J82_03575 [Muribaculaceae bacterium]|nr:hypothetical protein [Muribaculaceae bacterium]
MRDGIKVPDGVMEFNRNSTNDFGMKTSYKEKGTNKDGYKDGEWTIDASSPGSSYKITMNYKNGLLNGIFKIQEYEINKKTKRSTLKKESSYTFDEGHLIGNYKYVHLYDTLYFNYDNNGRRTGEWRLCKPNQNMKAGTFKYIGDNEFNPGEPKYEITDIYEIDLLGQKIPNENFINTFGMDVTLPLEFFKEYLLGDPTYVRYHPRVKLPTLHKNKLGIIDNF